MKQQEESEAENQVMVAKLDVDSIDSFSYMVDGKMGRNGSAGMIPLLRWMQTVFRICWTI